MYLDNGRDDEDDYDNGESSDEDYYEQHAGKHHEKQVLIK